MDVNLEDSPLHLNPLLLLHFRFSSMGNMSKASEPDGRALELLMLGNDCPFPRKSQSDLDKIWFISISLETNTQVMTSMALIESRPSLDDAI
jgi:hypothetical protein